MELQEIVSPAPLEAASPPPPRPVASSPAAAAAATKSPSAERSPYALVSGSPYLAAAHCRAEASRYDDVHEVLNLAARENNDDDKKDQKKNAAAESTAPLPSPPTPPATPSFRLLRAFLMMCVAWSATVTTCLGPFFPLYMKETHGASTTLVGLCFSVLALSQFIFCPLVIPISRRITRMGTLKTGLLISVVGGLLFGLGDSVPFFIIGRLLSGIGDALIDVSSLSFLIQYSPNIRTDVGLLEGSSSIGYLLGPLLGAVLFFELGFEALFLIMSAPYALLFLVLVFVPSLFPPPPTRQASDATSLTTEDMTNETHLEESKDERADSASPSKAVDASPSSSTTTPSTPPSPPLSTKDSLIRLGRALCSTPALVLYILIVVLVSGALGWMDTSLSEHLVLSLDISIEQAGFLFTIHTLAYLLSSFVAAHIAFRVGEWRAILTGSLVFSLALLLLGPIPLIHFRTGGKTGDRAVIGVMATMLAVLGLSEAFVFLPFVPLVHAHFQGNLGWSEEETEDLVSSVWATLWGAGQTLGPFIGGWLMDSMPTTVEVGCVEGKKERAREGAGQAGVDYHLVEMHCRSAFPWTAAVWGGVALGLAVLLWVGVMQTKRGRGKEEGEEEEGFWSVFRQRLLCCPRCSAAAAGSGSVPPFSSASTSISGVSLQEGDEGRGAEGGGGQGGLPPSYVPITIAPLYAKEAGKEGEEGREDGLSHPQ